LRCPLQNFQTIELHVADERQRVVQGLAAHCAPAAQAFQRYLPGGQLRALGGLRPEGEEHARIRLCGRMVHGAAF
jgi:hypothetical protein